MKALTLLLFLTTGFPAFCQINFERLSNWEEVARHAQSQNKLVFLHLEDSKCQQCNDAAAKGFESQVLKEKFAKNFVAIMADIDTEAGAKLAEKFRIKKVPVSLFIDPKGNILNSFSGSTSAGFVYSEQADVALKRRGEKQLSDYVKEYEAGKMSVQFLEEFIDKQTKALIPVDELLDQYLGRLPVDSLNNFRIVKFIYSHGPSVDSRAYRIIQAVVPRNVIDNIYKSATPSEAVSINNAIITSSYRKAVNSRSKMLAYQTNAFIQNSYGKDIHKGMMASMRNMMRFYYDIKDTVSYLREVPRMLDEYHMRITADSLARMDKQEMETRAAGNASSKRPKSLNLNSPLPSEFYHQDLNEHAWHFFQMSDSVEDLERALKWSYQSQEFFNSLNRANQHPMRLGNPAYIDTYAQLLYKLGRREEAIDWQTKAVEAQKITGAKADNFEETLLKMKAGESLK